MKTCISLLLLLGSFQLAISQNLNEAHVHKIAKDLANNIQNKMKGENLVIADFVDKNDQPSKLGKYLAEELSYVLVNEASDFNIIDRTYIRKLIQEAGMGDKGRVDVPSIQKLGRLKGITAVIYGKIFPTKGRNIDIFIKVIHLETQVTKVTIKGSIISTETIRDLMNSSNENLATTTASSNSSSNSITPVPQETNISQVQFDHKHLQIKLHKATRTGNYLDCEFQVISLNKNDNFSIKTSNTKLTDNNGQVYPAFQLGMNGRQSRVQCRQFLSANTPVFFLVRFANVPASASSFSNVALNCNSTNAYTFSAQLQNITIQ